jgi:Transposase DDE domain group 1
VQEAFDAAETLKYAHEAGHNIEAEGDENADTAETARRDLERIFRTGGVAALVGNTYGAAKDVGVYVTCEAIRGLADLEAKERGYVSPTSMGIASSRSPPTPPAASWPTWSYDTVAAPAARIRNAKDTGLTNLPLHDFAQNQIWCAIVALAIELTAWMQMLALPGHDARRWEPKRPRLRLLSIAGCLAVHQRQRTLHPVRTRTLQPTACQDDQHPARFARARVDQRRIHPDETQHLPGPWNRRPERSRADRPHPRYKSARLDDHTTEMVKINEAMKDPSR